jgi:hypothetical protein
LVSFDGANRSQALWPFALEKFHRNLIGNNTCPFVFLLVLLKLFFAIWVTFTQDWDKPQWIHAVSSSIETPDV